MSENDRCLRMADECERLASRTASAEDHATLLHMAQLWRELAEDASVADWVEEVSQRPGARGRV